MTKRAKPAHAAAAHTEASVVLPEWTCSVCLAPELDCGFHAHDGFYCWDCFFREGPAKARFESRRSG